MKKQLPALVCVFLLFILCSCSFLERGPQSSPEKLMEAYLEAFQKNDFETMLRFTAELEESEEELAYLKNFIQMIELEKYSIAQVDYLSESEAAVKVNLTLRLMGHEKTQTDSVRVVRKEGKWFLREGILDEK